MVTLHSATCEAVDAYWAAYFACPVPTLRPSRTHVVPQAGLALYDGVYAMSFDSRPPIVAVPPLFLDVATAAAAQMGASTIDDASTIAAALPAGAGTVIGPAVVFYCDDGTLRERESTAGIRVLRSADADDLAAVASLERALLLLNPWVLWIMPSVWPFECANRSVDADHLTFEGDERRA